MSASPQSFGIKAKKSLGQNFLVDQTALDRIAGACRVSGANVVEVGPGYGALTEKLLALEPSSLTLVELDADMVAILHDRRSKNDLAIPAGTRFEVRHEDVLEFVPKDVAYRVVANIPYYITSPILERFLYALPNKPEEMAILMQKEVADRILAKDGKESGLSIFCKNACARIEEVAKVPAGCFRPAPKVDSAVLRFELRPERDAARDAAFLKVVRAGFSAPRKKLSSNLANGLGVSKERVGKVFAELGIDENERAERLDTALWERLSARFSESIDK